MKQEILHEYTGQKKKPPPISQYALPEIFSL